MRWPPLALYMKFRSEKHGFGLWIPLFIIGPLFMVFLLAVVLVMLPFVLLALLVAGLAVIFEWQTKWWKESLRYARWTVYGLKSLSAIIGLLFSLTGTKVDVETKYNKVFIAVY